MMAYMCEKNMRIGSDEEEWVGGGYFHLKLGRNPCHLSTLSEQTQLQIRASFLPVTVPLRLQMSSYAHVCTKKLFYKKHLANAL